MGSTLFTKRYVFTNGRSRKKRPKTFSTEAAAKAWAEKNNVQNFEIVDMKLGGRDHKFRIVVK
ncbi:hypothetical protein KY311_04670 [Candidatus Woesearchaeota archaeon]|nr:hypothetical protein [Candidatus Woesearchaeota archaeon]